MKHAGILAQGFSHGKPFFTPHPEQGICEVRIRNSQVKGKEVPFFPASDDSTLSQSFASLLRRHMLMPNARGPTLYEFRIRIIALLYRALFMNNSRIIYLTINLEEAYERRERILSQAQAMGVPLCLIPAVAGRSLTPEQRACYTPERTHKYYNYTLTPNEIACVLSHRKALEYFLKSAAEHAVVLEDDADLQPEFTAGLEELTKRLSGWDIAKLYTGHEVHTTPLLPRSEGAPVQPVYHRKFGNIAVGFVYTRQAAQVVLAGLQSFWLPADAQIYQIVLQEQLRIIGLKPDLVRLAPGPSTINTDHMRGRSGKRSLWQRIRHRWYLWRNATLKMLLLSKVRRHLHRR